MGVEDTHLIAFMDWVRIQEKFDARLKTVFHVANERRASWAAGRRLKQKGVRAGVPDVIVPIPSGKYSALFIEMKIKPNKLTKPQIEFCSALHGLGHCVRVAWSSDQAIEILKKYLSGE